MLTIRSQDKTSLIVDDVVYTIGGVGKIYCDKVSYQEGFVIAEYSNKERAIRVLDMLEAFVHGDYEKLYNLGYKQYIITDYLYGHKRYGLISLSFQFPKDNEVE